MTDRPRRKPKQPPAPSETAPASGETAPAPTQPARITEVTPDGMIRVGQVLAVWGVRGEMRIVPDTANPERFRQGRRVFLRGAERRIITSRPIGKGMVLLHLDGITTPEMAAEYRGYSLYVREDEAPPLEPDWYYHFQLIGLTVVTDDGSELGVLVQILETGSNDVYIIRNDTREYLIPAIADVVQDVDIEAKRMTIHAMPGLLD